MTTRRQLGLLAILVVAAAAACGGGNDPSESRLDVATASFDLAVGEDRRFLAGLFAADRNLVLGGEVQMQFRHLGAGEATTGPVVTTTGTFLPVPGKEPTRQLDEPTVVAPADASGVYGTTVDFDRPGVWEVSISLQLDDGRELQGTSTFLVAEQTQVPAVGDPAPAVHNLTVASGAPAVAIDSRARGEDGEVPDPELHATTIAAALDEGRPIVVVVSTPTYCVSQFCGPITETIEQLASRYGEVADFVHLEVWRDFEAGELNDAAAAWIQTDEGGGEPWVFLVGVDGTIQARWDNVLDEAELVELLDGLAASHAVSRSPAKLVSRPSPPSSASGDVEEAGPPARNAAAQPAVAAAGCPGGVSDRCGRGRPAPDRGHRDDLDPGDLDVPGG